LGATVFLVGVGSCFFDPAAQAEIPQLVSRDESLLNRANADYWTLDTVARTLIGASVGGLLFAVTPWLPYAVAALLLAVSAAMVARLPARPKKTPPTVGLRREVAEGARLVWRVRELRLASAYMGVYNLAWNLVFGTLVLALQDRHQVSSATWGVLVASMAIGGFGGGRLMKRHPLSLSGAYGYGLITQAVGWAVVIASPSTGLTIPGFLLVGVASTAVSAVGGSAVHLAAPEGSLARVTSVIRLGGIGSAAVGSAASGIAASAGGLVAPTLLAVVLAVVVAGWALLRG
jgi:MFS family permease